MRLSLVCVLFDPAIPTSFFNFIQLLLYLYTLRLTHDGVVCSVDAFYHRESLPTIKSSVDTVHEGTITRVLCWRVPGHKYGVV